MTDDSSDSLLHPVIKYAKHRSNQIKMFAQLYLLPK